WFANGTKRVSRSGSESPRDHPAPTRSPRRYLSVPPGYPDRGGTSPRRFDPVGPPSPAELSSRFAARTESRSPRSPTATPSPGESGVSASTAVPAFRTVLHQSLAESGNRIRQSDAGSLFTA